MSEPSYIQQQLMQRMSPVECIGDGIYSASITFEPGFPGFEGHFPGRPIVPALCLVSVVEIVARQVSGMPELRFSEIKNMKFKVPLEPGDVATFKISIDNGGQLPFLANATVSTEKHADVSRIRLAFR